MVDKKKIPSDKEIKDLLKKAKKGSESKVDKSDERIIDKSVSKVDKAKTPDKVDLILSKLENFENRLTTDHQRLDRIENLLSKQDTDEQKKQLTPEEKLAQAQAEQGKAQGKQGQPGQTPEDKAAQAALQFQQDVAQAQAAQTQAQQQGQGQGQGQGQKTGQVLTPQSAWLLERAADAAKVIIPAILQSKGNSGNPLSQFFDQLKVYQGIESTILGGFFNFMKMLPSGQREGVVSGVMASKLTPTMTDLPSKSEIIK